jgi:hypothetical protein
MSIAMKFCGLTRPGDVSAAVEVGAAYMGLVFFEKSPRFVSFETARELALLAPPGLAKVALTVDAEDHDRPVKDAKTAASAAVRRAHARRHSFMTGETLMPLILMPLELEAQYENAKTDQSFWDEMDDLWTNYVGRPSPLYFAER